MSQEVNSQELRDYRWKNRILLLCEQYENLVQSKKQVASFKAFSPEMEERRLIILIYQDSRLLDRDLNILNEQADRLLKSGFQGVLLIGLDGGVKWESGFYAEPSEVLRIIDSMPMRRAEIKGKYDP